MAFVAALSGVVFVAPPTASADGLSNPSGTLTVECDGATSFIKVDWKGGYRKAVNQEGKGYATGEEGPDFFDCSGLTLTSYEAVPGFPDFPGDVRTAEQIFHWMQDNRSPGKRYAQPVELADLKIGDLLFFRDTNDEVVRDAEHGAFWAGDDTLFHAFSPSTPIGFTDCSAFFSSRFVGAYRVLGVETVANG
jgi:hypothetical protein